MTSTWSSAWSSSLSHRHRHHITVTVACHRDTVIDTVIVIATSYTVTLAINCANTKTRLKYGHYIAKSISRLLNVYSYNHRFDKKKKKDGVHDGIWLLIHKWIGASREDEKGGRWERIDGVCVCVCVCVCVWACVCLHGGKTSHCRSCD